MIDTAGLEEVFDSSLEGRMRAQTERAVADSDLALLVIDARAGITALDEHFARWLRRSGKPVALVANKCEGREAEAGLTDAYSLGLGQAIPISSTTPSPPWRARLPLPRRRSPKSRRRRSRACCSSPWSGGPTSASRP